MTPEQIAAQEALAKQQESKAEKEYQERLARKRAMRAGVSAEGIDNPFDVPSRFLDKRFHYCIVNDKPGRISGLEARGYELVKDPELAKYLNQKPGEAIKFATGQDNPAWAYLMRIEEELFQEDQEAMQALADEKMQQLVKAPKGLKFDKSASITDVALDKTEILSDGSSDDE